MTLKECRKCQSEKPLSEFYVNKRATGGYFNRCKDCVKARQLEWNKTEAGKATALKFKEIHKDDLKVYYAQYGRTAKAKAAQREYRQSEKGKETKTRYYIKRYGSVEAYWKHQREKLRATETPEQKIAWRKTKHAIESGKLVRQPCACGNEQSQAHHEDYSKPLEVVWLCASCHQRHHAMNRVVDPISEHPRICTTKRETEILDQA